ncbi:MAG TPA: HEAT repeat domain-containing protein [Pyrinomonadaceae bacterium]|jgi:hypothetical protein
MTHAPTNGHDDGARRPATVRPARRRTPWPLAVVAALFVVVPFLFWYGTWFGRALSDKELEAYLADEANPRHEQHALAQLGERVTAGDAGAHRWYPQVARLAASRHADVRMTAAWVMGRDGRDEQFRAALLGLLGDSEPIVRRNAALALVPFNDARGRAELLAMLRAYDFAAPLGGELVSVLPVGSAVRRETMLARVRTADGALAEIRAPLPGTIERIAVAPGAQLQTGQTLLTLAPDEDSVRNALVGLSYVGTAEDLGAVEVYARGAAGFKEDVKAEAARTVEAIRRRTGEAGARD